MPLAITLNFNFNFYVFVLFFSIINLSHTYNFFEISIQKAERVWCNFLPISINKPCNTYSLQERNKIHHFWIFPFFPFFFPFEFSLWFFCLIVCFSFAFHWHPSMTLFWYEWNDVCSLIGQSKRTFFTWLTNKNGNGRNICTKKWKIKIENRKFGKKGWVTTGIHENTHVSSHCQRANDICFQN